MIMHVVGNRPQLIKLAPLSRELKKQGFTDMVIHTGQHYDENMSDIFFEELGIEKPYSNLRVGSGTHAHTTGVAMIELEKLMMEIKPEVVVVYGDTNSTVAAAMAAAKLEIPIVHVEAGPRTFVKNNPEEINRTIVDHISTVLCCPDEVSVQNLRRENILTGVHLTGDIMYDTFKYCKQKSTGNILEEYQVEKENFVLMTWHRQENTSSKERMCHILDFIQKIEYQVVCPLHPRTKSMLQKYDLFEKAKSLKNLKIVEPIGYMEMVDLMNQCKFILCDSGGVSKETYFAGKTCYFMLNFNPWVKLVENGNIITMDIDDINDRNLKAKMANESKTTQGMFDDSLFGNGTTAKCIVDIMKREHLI